MRVSPPSFPRTSSSPLARLSAHRPAGAAARSVRGPAFPRREAPALADLELAPTAPGTSRDASPSSRRPAASATEGQSRRPPARCHVRTTAAACLSLDPRVGAMRLRSCRCRVGRANCCARPSSLYEEPTCPFPSIRLKQALVAGWRAGVLECRVEWDFGRGTWDDLVSDDAGPGELVEVGAAGAVAEHPPVLPGAVELAGGDLHSCWRVCATGRHSRARISEGQCTCGRRDAWSRREESCHSHPPADGKRLLDAWASPPVSPPRA